MNALLLAMALVAPPQDGWWLEFAPDELLFAEGVADPRRSVFALTSIYVDDSGVPGGGDTRWGIRMGARFPLFRFGSPWLDTPVQLDGHMGYLAEFDRANSADNLGWDGLFGLDITWLVGQDVAFQFGFSHDSSHLGDEYIESTGATRIGYTREEYRLGARWSATDWAAIYAGYGHAKRVGNSDVMADGRAQLGFDLEGRRAFWGERLTPFLSLDIGAFEEDDWEPNFNLQTGVVRRPANGSVWRFGLEYYDGRSTIGELFQAEERHVALGVWLTP